MIDIYKAAQKALEALVQIHPGNMTPMAEEAWNKAIVMLGAALAKQRAPQPAKPAEQPVATVLQFDGEKIIDASMAFFDKYPIGTELYVAPQPAIPPGWAEAYAAFKGAFDMPLARRRDSSEYAQEARRLLREFNDAMHAATDAPQPAKREQEPVEIEMPEYHSHGMGCGLEDRGITDRYEAMEYGWYEAIDRVKEELANFGPLYTAPQPRRRLTNEEIDNTTRKQVDDLLDHIYEYGTAAEGIDYRVRAIARAIERAHGIGEHE